MLAFEHLVFVHLVRETENIVLVGDTGELPHVCGRLHRAGRVRGAVDDEHRRVLGDRVLDRRGVERQVLAQPDGLRVTPGDAGQRLVGDESGVGEDHFLAGVDVSLQCDVQRLAAAGGGDDIARVDA